MLLCHDPDVLSEPALSLACQSAYKSRSFFVAKSYVAVVLEVSRIGPNNTCPVSHDGLGMKFTEQEMCPAPYEEVEKMPVIRIAKLRSFCKSGSLLGTQGFHVRR